MSTAPVKLGPGRDETYWAGMLEEFPLLAEPAALTKVMLLAPHPDDEVLACGGLLQRWSRIGQIDIWMVTDGEACFGDDVDVTQVAARRRMEAVAAHQRLGIDVAVSWLSLPDSQVTRHRQYLHDSLARHLTDQTILIAPLPQDGHPDHDCTGAIARDLAEQRHLLLLQYPMWMWHSGSIAELQRTNGVRVEMSEAEKIRKRDAIAAFYSQIRAEHGPPVLPRSVLRHFRRPFEVFFVEDFRVAVNSSLKC